MSSQDPHPPSSAHQALPPLPVTWRPRRTRVVAYVVAVAVLAGVTFLAVTLPSAGPAQWRAPDRVGIVLIGVAVVAVLHLLARPRITADENGLTVVNLVRRRQLEWAEVVQVNLRQGDPWVMLDLADGETLAAMGIQTSGGESSRRAAGTLAALVAARSRTERDD